MGGSKFEDCYFVIEIQFFDFCLLRAGLREGIIVNAKCGMEKMHGQLNKLGILPHCHCEINADLTFYSLSAGLDKKKL